MRNSEQPTPSEVTGELSHNFGLRMWLLKLIEAARSRLAAELATPTPEQQKITAAAQRLIIDAVRVPGVMSQEGQINIEALFTQISAAIEHLKDNEGKNGVISPEVISTAVASIVYGPPEIVLSLISQPDNSQLE
jgi:hypothetical protein